MGFFARSRTAPVTLRQSAPGPMLWRAPCARLVTAVLILAIGELLAPPAARAQNAERVEAVQWARDGEYDRAITRLRELRAAYPQDAPIAADLAVILQWAGRDKESLEVFDSLGAEMAPDYALIAAARAARSTGISAGPNATSCGEPSAFPTTRPGISCGHSSTLTAGGSRKRDAC